MAFVAHGWILLLDGEATRLVFRSDSVLADLMDALFDQVAQIFLWIHRKRRGYDFHRLFACQRFVDPAWLFVTRGFLQHRGCFVHFHIRLSLSRRRQQVVANFFGGFGFGRFRFNHEFWRKHPALLIKI